MKFTIAAALAVVTALIEFTVVPYLKIGDAVPHPVLVFGVITALVGGLEVGLTWAFVGGLALDIVTQRPLGSTSFSLLIAVGVGYLVGSFLGRIRILAPIGATAVASPLYSMLILLTTTALTTNRRRAPTLVSRGHAPSKNQRSSVAAVSARATLATLASSTHDRPQRG